MKISLSKPTGWILTAAVLTGAAPVLRADQLAKVRYSNGAAQTATAMTVLSRGDSQRIETGSKVVISRPDRQIELDMSAKTYRIHKIAAPPATLVETPAKPDVKVTDTGESRASFGLEARHLITTMGDTASGRTEVDGWYVEPQYPIEYTAKTWEPGKTEPTTVRMETLEFSRAPLDESLFEVPAGFTEVADTKECAVAKEETPAAKPKSRFGLRNALSVASTATSMAGYASGSSRAITVAHGLERGLMMPDPLQGMFGTHAAAMGFDPALSILANSVAIAVR